MILPKWSVCDFWSAKCRESEDIISLYLNCHRSGFAKLFDNSFKWLWQNLFQVGTHTQRQVAERLGSLCQLCRRSTLDILTNGFVVKVDYFNLALKFLAIFQKRYIYMQKMYMYKITNILIYCIYIYTSYIDVLAFIFSEPLKMIWTLSRKDYYDSKCMMVDFSLFDSWFYSADIPCSTSYRTTHFQDDPFFHARKSPSLPKQNQWLISSTTAVDQGQC